MEYFFSQPDKLKDRLGGKRTFLFLDFDGTLTPIAQTPDKAIIPKDTKDLLVKLSANPYCKVAIISGRAISDIKTKMGIKGIIYAGNHGLEIEGPKIKFRSQVSPMLKSAIRGIYKDAVGRLSKIKGVLIEDKGLTISIHYRLVGKRDIPGFRNIFNEVVSSYVARGKIKIDSGKKVYEIKPPVKWGKGRVVLWLLAKEQFQLKRNRILPVYIGDDATDEDAFRVLKKKGLTIFVGRQGNSEARYYLKSTAEVARFLRLIRDLKPN